MCDTLQTENSTQIPEKVVILRIHIKRWIALRWKCNKTYARKRIIMWDNTNMNLKYNHQVLKNMYSPSDHITVVTWQKGELDFSSVD